MKKIVVNPEVTDIYRKIRVYHKVHEPYVESLILNLLNDKNTTIRSTEDGKIIIRCLQADLFVYFLKNKRFNICEDSNFYDTQVFSIICGNYVEVTKNVFKKYFSFDIKHIVHMSTVFTNLKHMNTYATEVYLGIFDL